MKIIRIKWQLKVIALIAQINKRTLSMIISRVLGLSGRRVGGKRRSLIRRCYLIGGKGSSLAFTVIFGNIIDFPW